MNPKILGVIAVIAAGAAGGIALKSGEAVDVDAVQTAEDGTKSIVTVRCKAGEKEGELACGDLPAGTTVVPETASAPYVTLSSAGAKASREQPCACGPVEKSDCTVDTGEGRRPARPGEHLAGGTWSGACVPKACFEHSAFQALGSALPPECGGKNFGAKASTAAPAVVKVEAEVMP